MLHNKFYHEKSGSVSDGKKVIYPDNMDKLMIPLCNAINKVPGLQTAWCCQGHLYKCQAAAAAGLTHVYVSVYCDDIKALNLLTRIVLSYNCSHQRHWVLHFGVHSPGQCGTSRVRVHLDLNPIKLTAKIRSSAIRDLTKEVNEWRKKHEQT